MPNDPATAYASVIMLMFGDLRLSSTFGDRRGITIKVSSDRYLEYDQIGIQATERFCIVNHDVGGLAATSRGPIVGLYGVA
jgi:HK97 family phage major capsid protein